MQHGCIFYEKPAAKREKGKTLWSLQLLPESLGIRSGRGMERSVRPARFDRLPWFSYHSADAVHIEGTVL